MPTPNLNLPQFTTADTAKLDTLLNSITTALDTSLAAILAGFGARKGTNTQRDATITAGTAQTGDLWVSTTDGYLYRYSGSVWMFAPGQLLASMTSGSNFSGAAGTLVGTIASTPVLPIGQRIKLVASYSQFRAGAAGDSVTQMNIRNSPTSVSYTTFDKSQTGRAYSPAAGNVVDNTTLVTVFTTTAAARVTAALYLAQANSGVYGPDGIDLLIEAL